MQEFNLQVKYPKQQKINGALMKYQEFLTMLH